MERLSLGGSMVVVALAALACKGSQDKTNDTPSATAEATSAPAAATEAPAVDAAVAPVAVAPVATPAAVKNPCKDPDDVFLGTKCYRKCKADMDCDGVGGDCLPFNAANPTKVCRLDEDPSAAAPAAAPIPKGAVVANPDSFQFGGPKCPSGWS